MACHSPFSFAAERQGPHDRRLFGFGAEQCFLVHKQISSFGCRRVSRHDSLCNEGCEISSSHTCVFEQW